MRGLVSLWLAFGLILGASVPTAVSLAQSPSVSDYLPDTLPLTHAACFRIDGEGTQDFPAVVERFAGVPDAAAQLETLGWEDGAYRQFGCDTPPEGSVGWIDMSVHRFRDSAAAEAALSFFASSGMLGTSLQEAPAIDLGDSSAALAGPAVNGEEYTLYLSTGPLLFRVTGVAPVGDPRTNVEVVMTALVLGSVINQDQDVPVNSPPLATLPPSGTTTGSATYSILDLGTGAGNWSAAYHINAQGQVLMTTGTTDDPMTRLARDQRSLIWHNGAVTDLTALGIGYTIAINDLGTVLAAQMGRNLLYESDSGSLTPLRGFEHDAYPADINNAGVVTGQIGASAVIANADQMTIIRPPPNYGFVGPSAINGAGHVAGTARPSRTDESVQQGVLFADGVLTVLDPAPGASSSRATDLNDIGQVAGTPGIRGMHSIPDSGRAFLYDHETRTTTDFGTLPGYQNSVAFAVNNVSQVVGFAWLPLNEADPIRTAYMYDHRTGVLADLNQLVPQGSGWYLMDAFDINDAGQIVGRGLVGGEMHAFLLTPTG
jgi:hypothetical protein